MFKKYISQIIIGIVIITTFSCNKAEVTCPDTQSFDFKISFKKVIDTVSTSLVIYHPNVGSFTTNQALPFSVSIPVNITSDSTSIFIDFIYKNDSIKIVHTDTIAFTHISTNYLNHQECGFLIRFEITDSLATKHHIDSVSWVNNLIDEDNELNLEIYY